MAEYDLILMFHHTSKDFKGCRYQNCLSRRAEALAAKCCNAREFKDMVQEKYPGYSGENYPDMTVGFSSPKMHRQENRPKTHRTVFLP